jgi:bifunctional DNA-binding transcriptional regulator/antitoxin component of YhaV-PrlF toxin-antitoxin module
MKTGTFFVTLPSQIVRAKNWNKGDHIIAEINKDGNIVLKKKESVL